MVTIIVAQVLSTMSRNKTIGEICYEKKFNFYAITAEDLENNIKGV